MTLLFIVHCNVYILNNALYSRNLPLRFFNPFWLLKIIISNQTFFWCYLWKLSVFNVVFQAWRNNFSLWVCYCVYPIFIGGDIVKCMLKRSLNLLHIKVKLFYIAFYPRYCERIHINIITPIQIMLTFGAPSFETRYKPPSWTTS